MTLTTSYPTDTFGQTLAHLLASFLAIFSQSGDIELGAEDRSKRNLDNLFGDGGSPADMPDDEEPGEGEEDEQKPGPGDDGDDFAKPFDEMTEEEQRAVLDKKFEEQDDDEEDEEDDEDDEDDEAEDEEDEAEDEEDEAEDEEDEEDEAEDEEDEAEDEEDEAGEDDETLARKQARENGRRVKVLEQEKADLELELEELRDRSESLANEVQDLKTVKLRPEDDPEYTSKARKLEQAINATADDMPRNGAALLGNYTAIYDRYEEITGISDFTERKEAMEDFKSRLAQNFSEFEEPTSELEPEDRRLALGTVDQIMTLVKTQSERTEELIRMKEELTDKAQKGQLAAGVREYTQAKTKYGKTLEDFGQVDKDFIAANPESLEAMLGVLIEKQPDKKKALPQIREKAMEFLLGAEPLTQEKIDRIVEKGEKVEDYRRGRSKRVELTRKELLPKFALFLALEDTLAEIVQEVSTKQVKKAEKSKELLTLGKASRKKKTRKRKPAPKPKPQSAEDTPLSTNLIFGD